MHSFLRQCISAATISMLAPAAYAVYPAVAFNEVAQTADLVFSGTVSAQDYVTSGGAPYTEVTFSAVDVLASTADSRQRNSQSIKLVYAGGQLGDQFLEVSDSPALITGQKYVVFMLDDGKNYLNPIVGGPGQGLFKVLTDQETGSEYIANAADKAVIGAQAGKLELSAARLIAVSSGAPRYEAIATRDVPAIAFAEDGRPALPGGPSKREQSAPPISLSSFENLVLNPALETPLAERRLQLNAENRGKFIRNVNGRMETVELKPASEITSEKPATTTIPDSRTPVPEEIAKGTARGQALEACGTHNLKLTMEHVPTSWWEHPIVDNCMWIHNQFMDVFRTTASDGSFGNNGVNEFGGYPSNATLSGIYGTWDWGGSLGVCFTYRASSTACARITQSDIFWNPGYNFSDNIDSWWQSSSVYNFRATTIHEIGHAWGYQTGDPEQYNYDSPSIMHSIYSDIYETGHGFHADDAYIFRRHYDDQTSILSIRDLGVESYYASNGLKKSTMNGTTFARGSQMNFNNVTVENMSNATVNNVRVRFYLGTGRDFNSAHYQVGGDWTFSTLAQEQRAVSNYDNNTIPSSVPTGTYYVLAYVDSTSITDAYASNNIAVFTDRVTITAPAPGNDNLANATIVTGFSGTTSGSNQFATKQSGEPNHAGNSGGASVWYSWTAPATGTATVDTSGSTFDTVLGVYTGSSFPLTLVMQDDDGMGGGSRQSRVTFPATNGTTYKIAVDGYNGVSGTVTLNRSLSTNSGVADWSVF